jgi:hypothetical protein
VELAPGESPDVSSANREGESKKPSASAKRN